VVHDLQIAFDGDRSEVHEGAEQRTEVGSLAQDNYAQPVPARSAEFNVEEIGGVRREQKERAEEIQQILVEYQHLLLVLFGHDQSVQNHPVEDRSH